MDKNLVNKSSQVSERVLEYANLVDKYTIISLADQDGSLNLSQNAEVFLINQKNKILALWKMKKKIKKVLKSDNYDLITVQDIYFIAYLAIRMASRFKIDTEIQVHGFEKFKGFRKRLVKYVLKRANSIRVVSERLKKQLIQNFKVLEDKITVVPVYVKTEIKEKELKSKENDKFIFLTVGRLVPVKNIEIQIKAIDKLKNKYENIELWIVGDGLKKYELRDNIKFFGYQEDLSKFYQQADCFLLTSSYEGWGIVIIEAASYGLPIIMTDVGCAGEFIKDGQNGSVVAIQDQEALESKMIELIENEGLRAKLGNNAKESVKSLLSKEETLNLYKQSWEKAIK